MSGACLGDVLFGLFRSNGPSESSGEVDTKYRSGEIGTSLARIAALEGDETATGLEVRNPPPMQLTITLLLTGVLLERAFGGDGALGKGPGGLSTHGRTTAPSLPSPRSMCSCKESQRKDSPPPTRFASKASARSFTHCTRDDNTGGDNGESGNGEGGEKALGTVAENGDSDSEGGGNTLGRLGLECPS